MKELIEIIDDTSKSFARILCFPIRLCYWICKNLLDILGVNE